jgi:hypothetical protein
MHLSTGAPKLGIRISAGEDRHTTSNLSDFPTPTRPITGALLRNYYIPAYDQSGEVLP